MSGLLFTPPVHRRNPLLAQQNHQRRLVLEISDDDDDDPPTLDSHRHPRLNPRRKTRAPSTPLDSHSTEASSSSEASDSDAYVHPISTPPHKRVKRRHSPIKPPKRPNHRPSPPSPLNYMPPAQQAPPDAQYHRVTVRYDRQLQVPATRPAQSRHLDITASTMLQEPYYYDAKVESRMYRGPGYERFPVVLGTVEGHREICDKWDRDLAINNERATRGLPPLRDELAPQTTAKAIIDPPREEITILHEILEVLPDIEHQFALQKIRDHLKRLRTTYGYEVQELPATEDIVSQILEAEKYPKQVPPEANEGKQEPVIDETGATIVWDKTLLKNSAYLKDAVVLLAGQFPHIPTHYIYKIVQDKRSVFGSYIKIDDTDAKYFTLSVRPYLRSKKARTTLEKKYQARTAYESRDPVAFAQMVNELQAAKQHLAREAMKLEKQKEKDDFEAANLEAHRGSGSLIECQCCFDEEIPINRAVACEGDTIHFFCFGCVLQLADTQIGLMKYEMLCMDGGGCNAQLSTEGIGQAVPMKTFDRLAFNQQQAEITAAGIEGLEQCPFCDFKGICGPIEEERIFNCQNPDCLRATCRLCKANAHVPKTCEEVKADRGLDARHLVEEARTEAMLRICPKCKVKIIKELGCNKMVCNQCSCIMCYVCKADISHGQHNSYEHFQRAGAKCKLYDDANVDRHEVEADEAEKEAIKKAKAENADLDEKLLQIDTGSSRKKPKTQAHPHHQFPDIHNMMPGVPPMPNRPNGDALNNPLDRQDAFGQPNNFGQQIRDLHPQRAELDAELANIHRQELNDGVREYRGVRAREQVVRDQIHQHRQALEAQQLQQIQEARQRQHDARRLAQQAQYQAAQAGLMAQQAAPFAVHGVQPGYNGFMLQNMNLVGGAPMAMFNPPPAANNAAPPGWGLLQPGEWDIMFPNNVANPGNPGNQQFQFNFNAGAGNGGMPGGYHYDFNL